jgi:hypothetical protein
MREQETSCFSVFGVTCPWICTVYSNILYQYKLCDFSLAIQRFSVSLNNCVLLIVYSTLLTNIIRSSFTIIGIRSYLAGVC